MFDKRTNLGQEVNNEVKKFFGDVPVEPFLERLADKISFNDAITRLPGGRQNKYAFILVIRVKRFTKVLAVPCPFNIHLLVQIIIRFAPVGIIH